jgi:molybdopterin guanine dinucleotide-containing S/N-oxide reductase-like protein
MSEEILTNGTCGGLTRVYVKDGKITRIRPIVFAKTDAQTWTIEARGKKFIPPRKTTMMWFAAAERSRIYSESRIKYPYKRVDFDPKGKRNTQNRGKSGYERISWDEALDLVADEIKRIRKTYGPAAITASTSSHHNWGMLYYKQGPMARFFRTLGYTELWDNPDSWEGWHWGAVHAFGHFRSLGMAPTFDLLEDALKNCEMIVVWGNDPCSSGAGLYTGQDAVLHRYWLKDAGIKFIFIDPYYSPGAVSFADKWIAPRPGTDAAMAEAIAYVWLKEDTYDKFFIENRTLGFDEFKAQTLGKKDGTPRTPGWASEITGVPAHDIVALAKDWAAKRTMLTPAGFGGPCRTPYATEWARLLVYLAAMQGFGKPGVNFYNGCSGGTPSDREFQFPGYGSGWWDMFSVVAKKRSENKVTQKVYRLLLPDAVLNPPVRWLGEGFCAESLEQQFKPYLCPEPGPNGAEIKMVYRHGSSFISTMTETNRWVRMYQSPKLEFAVNQDCWWGSETRFSDVVLPACTNFEHADISEMGGVGGYGGGGGMGNYRILIYQNKCIEPLFESKPDYEIYTELAERLGIKEEYTEGNSEEDWIKKVYDKYNVAQFIAYEDLKKKGYFLIPMPKNYKPTYAHRWFYEGRPCDEPDPSNPRLGTDRANELATYSGKVEFVSQSLLTYFPDDEERPPLAKYIPSWEDPMAAKYPLQLISPHNRFSFHTNNDGTAPWLDEIPGHRVLKDGYPWWPIRLHPIDANARGIKRGDIIKMYNDRGTVLGIADVTERMKPGVVHSYEASRRYDPIEPGKPGSPDRGACVNQLTPSRMLSKNACGMVSNDVRVEISKWEV